MSKVDEMDEMNHMRRDVKASVFTFLLSDPKYAVQLYESLHPDDIPITEDDCKIITLENILVTGLYNDFSMEVRGKVILLAEAQSKFSFNIPVRQLMYLAATYQRYIDEHTLDVYSTKPISIPRPELYVVYTGKKKDVPDTVYLSDLYEGESDIVFPVKVIKRGDMDNSCILPQYIRFCEVSDENRKKYGYTTKAVDETIRQCIEEGVLAEFLKSRMKEVHDIMVSLFSQEKAMEYHDYNLRKEARQEGRAEGIAEGIAEGEAKGRAEGIRAVADLLTRDELAKRFNVSRNFVDEVLG